MKVSVKLCGIRSVESALAALDAEADFIGLNFVPTSKRQVSEESAKEIIAAVKGEIKIVGVFQNAAVMFVNQTAKRLNLDYVQLHGDEDALYCSQIQTNIIKSVAMKQESTVDMLRQEMKSCNVSFFLLDREIQGTGKMINMETAHELAREFKLFLAGGLTHENVSEAVAHVKPFAVDVAGGIETDGKEDSEKMNQFVLNAKGVEL